MSADMGVFDLALMSRVMHHIPERAWAADELARVVRVGGRVVIRTTFRERLDTVVHDYWPQLRASAGTPPWAPVSCQGAACCSPGVTRSRMARMMMSGFCSCSHP